MENMDFFLIYVFGAGSGTCLAFALPVSYAPRLNLDFLFIFSFSHSFANLFYKYLLKAPIGKHRIDVLPSNFIPRYIPP